MKSFIAIIKTTVALSIFYSSVVVIGMESTGQTIYEAIFDQFKKDILGNKPVIDINAISDDLFMNYMYMYIYVLNPTYTKNEEEEVVKKVSGTIKTRLRWKDLYFLRMSQGYLNKLCAKKPFVDECKAGAKQIYMKVKAALQDTVSYKIQHQNELIQIEKASSWEDVMDGIIRVLTIDDFDQKEHNDNMFDELITDNWIVKKSMQEFINNVSSI